ncbi:MAG TPA: GNAT family N-acetyltransferase [Xanthobacteraceae bacterium]|nr:GNAT family N-acetyltransferase [Xanthobacteraceae bacterium]
MTPARAAPIALTRERADETPRRVAAARIEWKPLGEMADARDAWRDLAGRALEPNVFYDPAFALPAAPVFGAPGAVAVWSKSGRLIGLFPARIERRYGVMGTLTGWTHPYAPFGIPLVDRDEADAAIIGLLDHAEAEGMLLVLPLIAEGPFAAALSRALLRRGGATERYGAHARALLAPDGVRKTYLDRALSGKKLKELRRQRRRLLEHGLLKLATARDAETIVPALSDYLRLEAAGWKGRAGTAARRHAAILNFMHDAVTALAAQGGARVDRLVQDERTLAATITLRAGETAWLWKIAYNEAARRASPGVQLTLDVTESILADATIARVDSCATADHPMIDHLWRERLALADLLIAPSAAAMGQFRIARHLETLRRSLIASAKRVRDFRPSS